MNREKRFRYGKETLLDFADEFLVVCPSCCGCAHVKPREAGKAGWFDARRLLCPGCGHLAEWAGRGVAHGGSRDWYFHRPLWLAAPCCGTVLWAHNLRHLAAIEAFVAAELREQRPDAVHGWSNRSLFNRLPREIQAAKNREAVLRTIRRLRDKRG
jgi:hypothetical protein